MHLMPKDMEKLMLHYAGEVASKRKAKGLKLNYVEAVAYISMMTMEMAREGLTLSETVDAGGKLLKSSDCMAGVPAMVSNVQVEATFTDGTKLISIHNPIGVEKITVGETVLAGGEIEINAGKEIVKLDVKNLGTRPVQIGSHFHFYEANSCMEFDREKAYGYRLDIPSGTAVRFEPNETKKVSLVKMSGKRKVYGANGKVNGFLDEKPKENKKHG